MDIYDIPNNYANIKIILNNEKYGNENKIKNINNCLNQLEKFIESYKIIIK